MVVHQGGGGVFGITTPSEQGMITWYLKTCLGYGNISRAKIDGIEQEIDSWETRNREKRSNAKRPFPNDAVRLLRPVHAHSRDIRALAPLPSPRSPPSSLIIECLRSPAPTRPPSQTPLTGTSSAAAAATSPPRHNTPHTPDARPPTAAPPSAVHTQSAADTHN